jgi:hypothetical protein
MSVPPASEYPILQARAEGTVSAEVSFDSCTVQDLALTLDAGVLHAAAELPQSSDGQPQGRWRVPLADLILMKCWPDRYHLDRLRELL